MDWKAHLFLGALVGGAVAYFLGLSVADAVLFVALAGAGALLPDLDLRKSKASKIVYALVFGGIVLGAVLVAFREGRGIAEAAVYAAVLAAGAMAADFLFRPRHRGVMHGLVFLLAVSAAAYFLSGWFLAAAVAVGYCSHLAADGRLHL